MTGDEDKTAPSDGTPRLPKFALRIKAYGASETKTNTALNMARLHISGEIDAMLARIQNDLFDLGADLCVPEDGRRVEGRLRIAEAQVERLEREIDAMNEDLSPLTSFVLPGGTPAAAHLHLARTIARRAERLIVELAQQEKIGARRDQNTSTGYPSHLFVASRYANAKGKGDVLWTPGANRQCSG